MLLVSVALAGCGKAYHDVTHPVFLAGEDARALIDDEIGDMLAARHPGVAVGRSSCPYLLNLTGGRSARCTIPVAGASMRIDVTGGPRSPDFRELDALVETRDVEHRVEQDLELEYGVRFLVRCFGTPVSVVPVPEKRTCSVSAPGTGTRTVQASILADDVLFVRPLPGVETRFVRMLGHDAATRREGALDLDGAAVERYLRDGAGDRQHDELVRRGLIGPARCPSRVRLVANRHVTCTVRLGRHPYAYDLRFDEGRGLVITTDQSIVIVPYVRELVRRAYEHSLRLDGNPESVRIACGPNDDSVIFAEPGTMLPCTAQRRDGTYAFSVRIRDANGGFTVAPAKP